MRFLAELSLAALILGAPAASAQTPPAPPAAPLADAALTVQKAAFLALPEATRKAAQDALVWLGFYNGVADGDFGKRTRDAVLAFQASIKAPADGALSEAELKALLAAAQKARDAVGFEVVNEPKTGAKIGAPIKLLAGRDGAKLDFASSADPDLSALYGRVSAATPTRKVAYKAMKPDDFFVVSGQEGPSKFYIRFEKNEKVNPPIRGFTFTYPASRAADLDRVAIAVANSFEAFPRPAETPVVSATAHASEAPASGAAAPSAAGPAPTATALAVAPGEALTALKAADCPNPTVAGKPVRLARADLRTGLALIAGDFASKWRSSAFRRARAGSRRPWFRGIARRGEFSLARRRRDAAGHCRRDGDKRRRRAGVRSTRRARRPRCADRRGAEARRRRRARRSARHDRAGRRPRVSRRGRTGP
jgi:hypothetical protein